MESTEALVGRPLIDRLKEEKLARDQYQRELRIKARKEKKDGLNLASLELFLHNHFDYNQGIPGLIQAGSAEIRNINRVVRFNAVKKSLFWGLLSASGLLFYSLQGSVVGFLLYLIFFVSVAVLFPFFYNFWFVLTGHYFRPYCRACLINRKTVFCRCINPRYSGS